MNIFHNLYHLFSEEGINFSILLTKNTFYFKRQFYFKLE